MEYDPYGCPKPPPHYPAPVSAAAYQEASGARPLSDIRELTEPSLANRASCHVRGGQSPEDGSFDQRRDHSSLYGVPPDDVPRRSSSKLARQSASSGRPPAVAPPPPRGQGYTIPNRGPAQSLLREFAIQHDVFSADDPNRRVPSRTFVRSCQPHDILEFPTHKHPRVSVELQLGSTLYVGGGSIEGSVRVVVDDTDRARHKRALALARISVDLLGVEQASSNKKACFVSLATELVDPDHPPPLTMVESDMHISPSDPFWLLKASKTALPFQISLPLDVGPPPFQSKHARIRYVLCATVLVRDSGKQYFVRSSQDVAVLPVDDPEKALMSLPRPLIASDEYVHQRESTIEIIRVTAGLHRQIWVSGTSLFADVHIANTSRKTVKKLELQLERDILCYKHAAVSALETVGQTRIFDHNDRSILSRSIFKPGVSGWNGVPPFSTDTRTCNLDIPRGHTTVKCGKYFEVRYFLNVLVSTSHTLARSADELDAVLISGRKTVTVQLPIILIHMNSLDVMPNSVAQVAAAMEQEKASRPSRSSRSVRRPSQHAQGSAFAAPRLQSLDRMRAQAEDLRQLAAALDASPRKHSSRVPYRARSTRRRIRRVQSESDYHSPQSHQTGPVLGDGDADEVGQQLQHKRQTSIQRKAVARSNSLHGRGRYGSSLESPEAELEGDVEFSTDGPAANGVGADSKLDASRPRQFGFKNKKSMERWIGVVRRNLSKSDKERGHKLEKENEPKAEQEDEAEKSDDLWV